MNNRIGRQPGKQSQVESPPHCLSKLQLGRSSEAKTIEPVSYTHVAFLLLNIDSGAGRAAHLSPNEV
jgi:hypothetical protein